MGEDETLAILKEIRDGQKEAIAMQREQFDFVKKQYDRAEAIQTKAEKLQDRASGYFKIVLPALVILVSLAIFMIVKDF